VGGARRACGRPAPGRYPARVAFTLISTLLDQFAEGCAEWEKEVRDDAIAFPPLNEAIVACQDPANFDKITKIQRDLDDTTQVLHKTIDNILERGEKLDRLVERSDDLSAQSKLFYKQARKTNSCCVIC
jgi:synaptobrevin family protein YKT6